MLTLHGFPFSNYHNIVKHALMQKAVPFDEHICYPHSPEMMAETDIAKKIDEDPRANTEEFMAYIASR